jgi:L-arabinose isomerase
MASHKEEFLTVASQYLYRGGNRQRKRVRNRLRKRLFEMLELDLPNPITFKDVIEQSFTVRAAVQEYIEKNEWTSSPVYQHVIPHQPALVPLLRPESAQAAKELFAVEVINKNS